MNKLFCLYMLTGISFSVSLNLYPQASQKSDDSVMKDNRVLWRDIASSFACGMGSGVWSTCGKPYIKYPMTAAIIVINMIEVNAFDCNNFNINGWNIKSNGDRSVEIQVSPEHFTAVSMKKDVSTIQHPAFIQYAIFVQQAGLCSLAHMLGAYCAAWMLKK